jgi:hypothetical protein
MKRTKGIPTGFPSIKAKKKKPEPLPFFVNCRSIRDDQPPTQVTPLIREIRKDQLHGETDWGPARGAELWQVKKFSKK